MASTADSAKAAHKVKRSGKSLYQKNGLGAWTQQSTGQTAAQGRPDEARPPLVVSDINPPAVRHPHYVETPVPLPATLPMAMRTTAVFPPGTTFPTSTTTSSPGPAMQRDAFTTDDWERRQQAFIETQVPIPEPLRRTPEPFRPLPPSPPGAGLATPPVRAESPETSQDSEGPLAAATDDMDGSMDKPATTDAEARDTRARPASSSTSASFSAASVSSSASVSASASITSDPGDVIETEDGDTIRVGLQTNAEGRSYYTYIDDDGKEQNTLNAPFPPGKERCEDFAEGEKRPFICPVRDCRTLSWVLKHLSNHFHGKHNRGLFNDNGDGTISKVGSYENDGLSSPGIIVSRKPLPLGAPPPATPSWKSRGKTPVKKSPPTPRASVPATAPQSVPESVPQSVPESVPQSVPESVPQSASLSAPPPDSSKRSLRSDASSDAIYDRAAKRPKTATPVPLPAVLRPTPQSPPPMTDVLRYLHSHLSPTQQVPARPDVLALSKYRQARNVPGLWWEYHRGKTLDPLSYACILAYIVGRAEELNPCRRWKGISRLAEPCVALPPDLPAEAKAAFSETETCIACQYQLCCYRLKNECEWGNSRGSESAAEEAVSQQNHEPAVANGHSDKMDPDDGSGFDSLITQSEQYVAENHHKQEPQIAASTSYRQVSPAEIEAVEKMESWEMAPGTTKEVETNSNAIFSNAYLASQTPIAVSPRLSLNVLCLKPGQSYHWPAEVSKTRTCFVHRGKISVKIGAGEPVKLGPSGGIYIRPGQECVVSNPFYLDATIGCSSFDEDF